MLILWVFLSSCLVWVRLVGWLSWDVCYGLEGKGQEGVAAEKAGDEKKEVGRDVPVKKRCSNGHFVKF